MPLSQGDRDGWRSPAIGATGLIIGGLGAISLIRNMAHTPARTLLYLNRITSPRLYGYDIIPSLWSPTTLHAGTALTTGAILYQLSDSDRAQRFGATLSDIIQQPDLIQTISEASHELVHNTATQTAVALRNPTALLLMQSVGYHAAMRILPRTRSQQLLAVGIGIVGSTAMYLTPYALHPDLRGLPSIAIETMPRPTALPERAETFALSSNTRVGDFIAERESEIIDQFPYPATNPPAGTQIAARSTIIDPESRPDQRITALMEFGGMGMATGIYPALMALPISLARRHLTGVGMLRLEEHLEGLLTPQIQEVAERHIPSPAPEPMPDSQPPPIPPELPTETPSQEMPPESQPPLIPPELPTQIPTQDTLSSESTASREYPSPSGVRQEADIQDMPSPPTFPEPSASSPQTPTQVAPLETEIEQPPSPPERAQEATTQDTEPLPPIPPVSTEPPILEAPTIPESHDQHDTHITSATQQTELPTSIPSVNPQSTEPRLQTTLPSTPILTQETRDGTTTLSAPLYQTDTSSVSATLSVDQQGRAGIGLEATRVLHQSDAATIQGTISANTRDGVGIGLELQADLGAVIETLKGAITSPAPPTEQQQQPQSPTQGQRRSTAPTR